MTASLRTALRAAGARLLLLLSGLLVGALAAELGLRAVLLVAGDAYRADEARAYAAAIVRSARLDFGSGEAPSETQLHPYLGFSTTAIGAQLGAQLGQSDGRLVLFVGGSVAAGFANRADRLLAPQPPFDDRPLRSLQLATGGHKQPQQLHAVTHVFGLGLRPDLVVNLDGFNEVALGADNAAAGVAPSQPSQAHWLPLVRERAQTPEALLAAAELVRSTERIGEAFERSTRRDDYRSAIAGHLALGRLRSLRGEVMTRRRAFIDVSGRAAPPAHLVGPQVATVDAVERSIEVWSDSSRAIASLCAAYGCAYVHVLQPTLHDADSKPLTAAERADGALPEVWRRGVLEGYPRLRLELAQLGRDGILALDATRIFADVPQTLYVDGCHFNADGDAILAEVLLEFLREQIDAGRLELD